MPDPSMGGGSYNSGYGSASRTTSRTTSSTAARSSTTQAAAAARAAASRAASTAATRSSGAGASLGSFSSGAAVNARTGTNNSAASRNMSSGGGGFGNAAASISRMTSGGGGGLSAASRNMSSNSGLGNAMAGISRALGAPTGGNSNSPLAVSRPGSYAGPKGANALNTAARYASVGGIGAMPQVKASPGEVDTMARLILAETGNIKNKYGGISTPGMLGVADVIRNRVLSENFPNTVSGVMSQGAATRSPQFTPMGYAYGRPVNKYSPSSPGYQAASDVARAVLSGEQAPTVGNSLNYANLSVINKPGSGASAKTRAAFNSMTPEAQFVSAKNPANQHTFGTIGGNSDVNFPGPQQVASAQPAPRVTPTAGQPTAEKSLWESIQSGASNLAQTAQAKGAEALNAYQQGSSYVNSLPGSPEQKAAAIKGYAEGGVLGAMGGYLSGGFKSAGNALTGGLNTATAPLAKYGNQINAALGGRPDGGGVLNMQGAGIGRDELNTEADKFRQPGESDAITSEQINSLSAPQKAEFDRLVASGMSRTEAYYRALGYTSPATQQPKTIAYPEYYSKWAGLPTGTYA